MRVVLCIQGTNRLKRWILMERGWWSMTRRMSPSPTSQETTSLPTLAQVTRRETGIRRDASRRSSTTTMMHHLLHQETTMTTLHRKIKRLIKIILLIILVFRTIQMHIYFLFLLENLHTLMEKTIHFGAIKCVVIYFLYILVSRKLSKVECILIALITL
jgi:hypothetical protein